MKPLVVGLLAIAVVGGTAVQAQPRPPKLPHSHFNGCCNLGPATCDRTTPADCAQQGGQFQPLEVCDFATGSCSPLHAVHKPHAVHNQHPTHKPPAPPIHPVHFIAPTRTPTPRPTATPTATNLETATPTATATLEVQIPTHTLTQTPTHTAATLDAEVDGFLARLETNRSAEPRRGVKDAVAALPRGCKVVVTMSEESAQPACRIYGCCDIRGDSTTPACVISTRAGCNQARSGAGGVFTEGATCNTNGSCSARIAGAGLLMPRVVLFCRDQPQFVPSFALCAHRGTFFGNNANDNNIYHVEIGMEQPQIMVDGQNIIPFVMGDIDTRSMQAITADNVISKTAQFSPNGTKGCAQQGLSCHGAGVIYNAHHTMPLLSMYHMAALQLPHAVDPTLIVDSTEADNDPLGVPGNTMMRKSLQDICFDLHNSLENATTGDLTNDLVALDLCYALNAYKAEVRRSRQPQ